MKIQKVSTSFNFRCSAQPMKIKPRQKILRLLYNLEEVACLRIQRLESYNVHRAIAVIILFTDVSIIQYSYYVTLKIFQVFLNFVTEGY